VTSQGCLALHLKFQRSIVRKQTWLKICTWHHLYEGITVHKWALLPDGLFRRQSQWFTRPIHWSPVTTGGHTAGTAEERDFVLSSVGVRAAGPTVSVQCDTICCRAVSCRSDSQCSVRHHLLPRGQSSCAAARLLRLRVRIPPGTWVSLACDRCVF